MLNTTTKITCLLLISFLYTSCIGYSVKSTSYPTVEFAHHKRDYPVKGWKNIEIFDEGELDVPYQEIAAIVITGNESASDQKLFRKMKKLAGRYDADAIIFIESRDIVRESFDGISATLNIISIFDDSDCGYELDTGGIYDTVEFEGIAIKFSKRATIND